MAETVPFHPFGGPFLADPYPQFASFVAERPVFRADDLGYWVVSRHADCKEVLRDHERFSASNTLSPIRPPCPAAAQALADGRFRSIPTMTNVDPPAHTRTRRIAHLAFTPRRVAAMEDYVRQTVRRYVALLEEMGIPVTTERGPHGGYELVAGFRLPPLMFTEGEAVALALGLAAVRGLELADAAPAVAGAQAKLERVLPAALKRRARAVGESVAFARAQGQSGAGSAVLPALSASAHSRQGVRLRYRAAAGAVSDRDFDPYGLALSCGRWYTVGFCHLRNALRTFRLDRVESVTAQQRAFERPREFDVPGHVARSIATLPRRYAVEVFLDTNLEVARRELREAIGVLEPAGAGVLMRSQTDDLDWFARELARLPCQFEIRSPAELSAAVARLARDLMARVGGRAG